MVAAEADRHYGADMPKVKNIELDDSMAVVEIVVNGRPAGVDFVPAPPKPKSKAERIVDIFRKLSIED